HIGGGYSDHLPIYAKFSVDKNDTNILKTLEEKNEAKEESATILDLYKKEKLTENIVLEKAVVIYKNEDKAIIKKANDRAIFIYKNAKELKLGYSYNLQIHQIFDSYGLKEIKEFAILDEVEKVEDYKSLFLNGANIDIFDFKYENEIIT
ncbi:endonuclease, partial [Halarcobacter bivalviorum]